MKLGPTLSFLIAFKFSFPASMWLWWRASGVRRRGKPLSAELQDQFAEFFGTEILRRVTVAEGDPGLGLLGWLARKLGLSIIRSRGITLGREILIAPGESSETLLFHELVHVAQFEALGHRRFLEQYLRDWLQTGAYLGIGLERQAYALQARFEQGERFVVQEALGLA